MMERLRPRPPKILGGGGARAVRSKALEAPLFFIHRAHDDQSKVWRMIFNVPQLLRFERCLGLDDRQSKVLDESLIVLKASKDTSTASPAGDSRTRQGQRDQAILKNSPSATVRHECFGKCMPLRWGRGRAASKAHQSTQRTSICYHQLRV